MNQYKEPISYMILALSKLNIEDYTLFLVLKNEKINCITIAS